MTKIKRTMTLIRPSMIAFAQIHPLMTVYSVVDLVMKILQRKINYFRIRSKPTLLLIINTAITLRPDLS